MVEADTADVARLGAHYNIPPPEGGPKVSYEDLVEADLEHSRPDGTLRWTITDLINTSGGRYSTAYPNSPEFGGPNVSHRTRI